MLVNLKEILAIAEERKCAVGAFNTPNLECLLAVIDAAEKLLEYVEKIQICGEGRNSYSKTDHSATFMRIKTDYCPFLT